MKKIYSTILFVFAFIAFSNAQTFDFNNTNDNFVSTGAGQTLNATTATYTFTTARTNFYLDQKTVASGGTSLNTATANSIKIIVKNNSGLTNFTFRTSTGTVIAGPITITNGDTGFKTYTIPLAGQPLWTGTLDGWRIFFGAGTTAANETIEIDQIQFYNDPNLDTNTILKENAISIYPNPVKDILNITTTENIQKISVIDMLGKTIITPQVGSEINLSSLSKGAYFLSLETEKGISTKKIIKN